MELLKRHLFSIICGLVAAGSIGLGVLGVNSMSKVTDGMGEATALAGKLAGLGSGRDGPINQAAINGERQRIEQIQAHHGQVLDWAGQHNRHEPLVAGVFPTPSRDQKLDFRRAYNQRIAELLEMLNAGTVASEQDVADAAVEIAEEEKAAQRFGFDPNEAEAAGAIPGPEQEEPEQHPCGLYTDFGARRSARARANIGQAHQFRCYATELSIEMFNSINQNITPDERAMWDAQLSLWVQQEVIAALVRVNDREAEKLAQAGQSAWVGNLPIKELISIRTSPYVVTGYEPKPLSRPTEDGAAYPAESPDVVFTHSSSNELFDVVQFTLKMVVDARRIPEIVEDICLNNFNTLLRIAYVDMSKEPGNWTMEGKVYGSAPTVRVILDFETIFLADLYHPLLPDEVRADLGLGEQVRADLGLGERVEEEET